MNFQQISDELASLRAAISKVTPESIEALQTKDKERESTILFQQGEIAALQTRVAALEALTTVVKTA